MHDTELELKPCPFCGGKVSFDTGEAGLTKVSCPFCGVSTLWDVNAVKQWNNRTHRETGLLPCPLCGSKARVLSDYTGRFIHFVQCTKCGLNTKSERYPNDAKAVWNGRAKT